jgi:hypothetical protein
MRPGNRSHASGAAVPLSRAVRRTAWRVQDADGQVMYRVTDAGLAHEIYHALPGGDLFLLNDCPPAESG